MIKNKAFTLIEVLMAMAILSIAVLPIMSMYPSALRMSVRATELEEWSRTTETIVDYIKSRGYNNINTSLSDDYTDIIFNSGGYTSKKFGEALFGTNKKDLFLLNTKGMNLENYKFQVQIEEVKPTGIETVNLDFDNYTYHSNGGKGQAFYYGIVRIREKNGDFSIPDRRDMSFIVTPIENWK